MVATFARVPRWTLVLLRVYLGVSFLETSIQGKLGESWQPWPGWMSGVIQERMAHSMPLYGAFLSAVVLPHVVFFAHFVACAELVVGGCLLLGLATRGAALGGAFLTLNYLMLNGPGQLIPTHTGVFAFGSNDPIFVLGGMALSLGAAGRVLGADAWIHRRFPRWPLS